MEEEEGVRKWWVEALFNLSPFFCSLCLLPTEYLGKFKIYKLTAVSTTSKASLKLQNNLFKHQIFTKGRLHSDRILTGTEKCWTDSRKEHKSSLSLTRVLNTSITLKIELYMFYLGE